MKPNNTRITLPPIWITLTVMLMAAGGLSVAGAASEPLIVRDGKPRAEIVISDEPVRTVKLAAEELQTYIEKISGATLPIVTGPGEASVQIYVGKSVHTDRLGVTDEGLKYGAYRMLSGDGYLVLLGRDSEYTPNEPHLTRLGQAPHYIPLEFMEAWDELTGRKWAYPHMTNFRNRSGDFGIWNQDERGSLNAVYAWLRDLGVRWYLPGELGEIVPVKPAITLPKIDRTVHPDFAIRLPYQYGRMFGQNITREEVLWQLRMGFNLPTAILGQSWEASLSHGLRFAATGRGPELIEEHPEWFALYGGERSPGAHCLSSEGLFKNTVEYVRFMFDHYDEPMVSVMPEDGYMNLCQCELCEGKGTPERGRAGQLSDYVWTFVDRVAREVYKTHPDRKVMNFAYGSYLLPPAKIETLSPNVVIGICQWRAEFINPDQKRRYVDELREDWMKKLPEGHHYQFISWDYYLHARPGSHGPYPIFFPRIIAEDLRSFKGRTLGEFIEVYREPGDTVRSLAVHHLNLYVTARLWWDAAQDLDELLEEYYTLYYGPASQEMKAFIEYSEESHPRMRHEAEVLGQALKLFEQAQQKVELESIYGRRIALMAGFMEPLWALHQQLLLGGGLERDDNPEAWGTHQAGVDIVLDGKLDKEFWQRAASTYHLGDLVTGKPMATGNNSYFKAIWDDDASTLYVAIFCRDRDMANLNIGTIRSGVDGIFLGDLVEIHLETQNHAYYQLVVNPAGDLVDLDRRGGLNWEWSSGAEAAAHIGDGYWSVEVRIPVISESERDLDPNRNGIAGFKPSRDMPWYINVCRQRVRPGEKEMSALSPTGKPAFHDREKLGRFYVGDRRPEVIRALKAQQERARELERAEREGAKSK